MIGIIAKNQKSLAPNWLYYFLTALSPLEQLICSAHQQDDDDDEQNQASGAAADHNHAAESWDE